MSAGSRRSRVDPARSRWLAVEAGADPRDYARQTQASWERFLAGGELSAHGSETTDARLRPSIFESWRRSLDTGLDPVRLRAPIEIDPAEVHDRWVEHPLGALAHVLDAQLQEIVDESEGLIVVSDSSGLLLHIQGPNRLKARAAEMNFVEGARYSEDAAGTNGIGTALAVDHALQVFASEHFNQLHHGWTCSAAPVHDPSSGELMGVVDLSRPWDAIHPRGLALATAAARTMEQLLAEARHEENGRLCRRYADAVTRSTDLLVSANGDVLAMNGQALPKRIAVPAGGGEVVLEDGTVAVAESLGQGEAYILRRLDRRRSSAASAISVMERSERRVRELAREQAALRRVATLVARESPAEKLFAVVAEQVASVVDVPLVRVIRYENGGSTAELVGGWGKSVDPLAVGTHWLLDGPGVLASVLRTGRSARIDDYGNLPGEAAEVVRQAHMRAAVASPIVVGGRIWGAIAVLSPQPLRADTESRLADFTELVSTAIANAESRLELANSERRARKLATEHAALQRVATSVAEESPPEQVFAVVAEEVGQLLSIPMVAVARYEPDGSAIKIVGGWSDTRPLPVGARLLLDGPSVVASVWQTGRSARTDNAEGVPGEIAAAQREYGLRSHMATPIVVEGRLWGAIGIGSPERLSDDIEQQLTEFTELVSTAIANSDARDRLRRLLDEQAALRRVATLIAEREEAEEVFSAVAREIGHVFNVRLITLCCFQDDSAVVLASLGSPEFPAGSRWPLDIPGLSATIYETGTPARIDDFTDATGLDALAREAGVRAAVGVPIIVGGSVWGSINIASTEEAPFPGDAEQRLADFTELVSIAVVNSEAREQVRSLLDEQSSLRRVATLVATGPTPLEVFTAVAKEVAEHFHVPVISMVRFEPDGSSVQIGAWGEENPFPVGARFEPHPGVVSLIWDTGRPARIDEYADLSGSVATAMTASGLRAAIGAPIVVDGATWGAIAAVFTSPEQLAPGAEHRLANFTKLVGTAIANAESRAELAGARARVIAAADETRRQIERNLHDGAQQQLVGLALTLRSIEEKIKPAHPDLRAEVAQVAERLTLVFEELREISRGIHPAILSKGGIGPALRMLARRCPIKVHLDVRGDQRLPESVEVAVYYVVSEALTNAAKHAGASSTRVTFDAEGACARVRVRDDGIGGADPKGGSGLVGLRDRVEALGGTIEVVSPPGVGTSLDVEIPVLRN